MKRIIALVVLAAVVAMSFSGCKVVNFLTEYWDGMTKRETKEYVQDALEEKYGEEFVVVSMGIRSGEHYRELVGTCSPKSDDSIAFEFEANNFGERRLYDDYVQNVVRKQLKQNIDEVLSTYYDNFASEVYVTPLTNWYDSGIHSIGDDIIKIFSESFSDQEENETSVWIVLNCEEKKDGVEKLEKILQEMIPKFYFLNVYVDFFFADGETVNLCDEKSKSINTDRWAVKRIVKNGNYPMEMFVIYNDERGLVYCGNELNY